MYVVFADATYVLVGVAALSIGFGLCVVALVLREAFGKVARALSPIRQATGQARSQAGGVGGFPRLIPFFRSR